MLTPILLTLAILLFIIVALAGGFFFYVYWFRIQRPVPKLNGTYTLPGLEKPVRVARDKHAVPHIYAESEADLYKAQGFVHAQERLWQMEQNRRTAYGTLAEVFGPAAVDADRFSRVMGFRRAAEAELAGLDPETRQVLEWYAEGVNAFIDAHKPKRLAAEFNLLGVTPEPWTPLDTLAFTKIMAWALSGNWEHELTRLRLLHELGPHRAAELEPDYPSQNPIILEAAGSQEVTRMLYTAGLVLNQYEQLKQWIGVSGDGQGSNSWVLAPERTLTRRPLLANDPHLALQMPGIWYENRLSCPGLDVSGVSFAGVPNVIIGHNESIAWGMTNGTVDVQDLYLERAHPDDPTSFQFRDEWEDAQVTEETIQVRREAPVTVRVVVTRHGPLINGLLRELPDAGRIQPAPLALRWTGHAPGHTMRALYRLNRARNWDEFDAALADWGAAPQNVTYADREGNIGYILAGRIPKRDEQRLGLLPAPGWSGDHEWEEMIPHPELPRLFNPESGVIVTANNKMVGDDYPYFLGADFFPGWRAARIEELLAEMERASIRDMERVQLDTGSAYAQAFAPWIGRLDSDDPWERAALKAIRTWNYRMDTDSQAGLVFHYMLVHLVDMVFGDKLGPASEGYRGFSLSPLFMLTTFMLRAESKLLEIIEEQEQSVWYTDAKTGRARSRDDLLQEALTRAVQDIRKQVSDSTLKWHWGRSHQVRYAHPIGNARMLRNFFNRGPFPIGGDGVSPLQTRQAPVLPPGLVLVTPSYRQIYEVGAWDMAQTVTTAGQSGHPLSDHYDDQIAMFLEGVYHRTPWSKEKVEEGKAFEMILSG